MGGMEIGIVIGGEETGSVVTGTSCEGERGGESPRTNSYESEPSSSDSLQEEARKSFLLGCVFFFFGGGDWAAFVDFLFLGVGPFAPLTTFIPFPFFDFLSLVVGLSASFMD